MDAARWRWNRPPIVRAAADGWTTLALQHASDHFERRLLDGESVAPVLHRLRRLSAKFSQEDRHALQNWLLLRVTARQPGITAATFHALSAWPQAPAAPSLDVQPQQPCCTARGVDDRRLHAAFARLCATAYAYEPAPRLWALRAETTLQRPGQVRLELHCDETRLVVEVNPLFAPSEPLLAHVLLHELEHVNMLRQPPMEDESDAQGHGAAFDASFAAHAARAATRGVEVHAPPFGQCGSRELPNWWADAVRAVLSERQRARLEAALALDGGISLGGGDLFELMAGELECSVAQMAAAYLGCIEAPDVFVAVVMEPSG
jgi:hypothetical protein